MLVPLNDTAMAALRHASAQPTCNLTHVFAYRGEPLGDYGKAWYKALTRAGLEDFTWHGFRHTFNSWLAQAGVSVEVRRRLCGWSSREISDRYTHLGVAHLRPFAAVIDQMLASIPFPSQKPGHVQSQVLTA